MSAEPKSGTPRIRRLLRLTATSVLLVGLIIVLGLGTVALLSQNGSGGTWHRWADIGQAFGVINSVFSGLALVALVTTFWVQFQELRLQRAELALQRESLNGSHVELRRSAEASLRMLHIELVKMAMNDEQLAAVWPPLETGLPFERNRQYLYANLVYQHTWVCLRISDYTDVEVEGALRYLFTSRLMRDYWRAAGNARKYSLVPGTPEYSFAERAEGICREYEAVLAANPNHGEPSRPAATQG